MIPLPPGLPRRILVVGASARAACMSLRRAGFEPLAIDLFGDADLHATCPAIRVGEFNSNLVADCARLNPEAWLYTGGIENHPELIDELAGRWRLLGNPSPVVRAVRDPRTWCRALAGTGCPIPEFQVPEIPLPESQRMEANRFESAPRARELEPSRGDRRWIRKPFQSAGGRAIRFATESDWSMSGSASGSPRSFLQEYIDGEPYGALFIATTERVILLGCCRQIVGETWTGATAFQYAGSIGPLSLEDSATCALQRIGARLHECFSIQGVFGVDFVWNARGVWPIEINPRYPASFELVERARPEVSLARHVSACWMEGGQASRSVVELGEELGEGLGEGPARPIASTIWGKAIAYAKRDWVATSSFSALVRSLNEPGRPLGIADLPAEGTAVPAGQPIATVFASGTSVDSIREQLARRICELMATNKAAGQKENTSRPTREEQSRGIGEA